MDGSVSCRCDHDARRDTRGSCYSRSDSGGLRSRVCFDLAAIRQRRDLVQRPSVAALYVCIHSRPIRPALVRNRDVLLFVFGREVERFLGRRAYIALYAFLLVTPAALLTIWGLWERCGIAGSPELHFGIFIAFATIYPRVELLLRIMAKWIALILAAVYTFQLLAYHAWSDLMVLWTSIGVAFLFVEVNGAGPELAWWSDFKARFASKPKYHVLPKPRPRTGGSRSDADDVYTSIDPILDKISKFGIGSLTANERRQLDRERERLLKNSD